jgi:hypothetical protein
VIPRLTGAQIGASTPLPATRSATVPSLARELFERGATEHAELPKTDAEMQRHFARVSDNLRSSLGEDGYRALLGRAVGRTQSDPPVWTATRNAGLGTDLDIVAAVERHGAARVSAALESLVVALFDILSDLIGADMARNLLDHDDTRRAPARGEP